jgi:glyoxylase-like metal-dependent hydrolase (beta-lactamase superfamily II)
MNRIVRRTRREFLAYSGGLTAAGLLASGWGSRLVAQAAQASPERQAIISSDMVAQMRAAGATAKLSTEKLADATYVISGSGGNVAVLVGTDGKVLVDSGFATSAPQFKTALGALGNQPLRVLINTHWHFDHTDGNAWMHEEGAIIVAHENTRVRLSTPQDIAAFGLHFDPAPASALPQQTFLDETRLYFNGESLALSHYHPAHTDSDIAVHFARANVFHAGDTFFNGMYPMIDASSKGNITGMIAAAEKTLSIVDGETKIIPGHGPMGDRKMLREYRDMLTTVEDRVGKLKQAGKTLDQAVAAKPTTDLDGKWGKGRLSGDMFVTLVYATL